jgi:signal recognition particle receptor subunit beta
VPDTSRGKMVSMKTQSDRTLFFDLLPLDLGEIMGFKTRFLLYTVPGQVFYNATRKLVLKGADALVFVADSEVGKMEENKESLANLRTNLAEYGLTLDTIPWVIQYNKRDLPNVYTLEELNAELNPGGAPFFEAVASEGKGVFETFRGVSHLLMEKVTRDLRRSPGTGSRSGSPSSEEPAPVPPPQSQTPQAPRMVPQQAPGQAIRPRGARHVGGRRRRQPDAHRLRHRARASGGGRGAGHLQRFAERSGAHVPAPAPVDGAQAPRRHARCGAAARRRGGARGGCCSRDARPRDRGAGQAAARCPLRDRHPAPAGHHLVVPSSVAPSSRGQLGPPWGAPVPRPLTAPPRLPSLIHEEVAMSRIFRGRAVAQACFVAVVALSSLLAAVPARAGFDASTSNGFGGFGASGGSGFTPLVPISGFARAASWFDPSRLHLSSTVSVGSAYGVTSALQVTRLSYQFGSPLSMSVSIGNSFGPNAVRGTNPFFLEGFDLTWRPNANSVFRVEMHDVRSPLQMDPRGYGYGDPFRTPY